MKDRLKLLFKTVIFLIILCLCLAGVMTLTQRKESYNKNKLFFEEAREGHLDVLFLGSSHVINGINPIDLYEKYGITSYNLGGHGSLLKESYWQLIRALDYCKPEYVVVDCYMMDRNYDYIDEMYEDSSDELKATSISQLHLNLDAYPLSKVKIAEVNDLVHDPKVRMQYLFDFSIYHSRWSDLDKDDFEIFRGKTDYNRLMGATMRTSVNDYADEGAAYDPGLRLPEHTVNEEYLMKIIDECQRDGIGILVTYLPFAGEDNDIMASNSAGDIAAVYGVPYINMMAMPDLIDMQTDLADHGHLSITGASKVTDYIGQWLRDNTALADHRFDDYHHIIDDLSESYDAKIFEDSVYSSDFLAQLNLLTMGRVSFSLFVSEDSPALSDPRFRHLVSNLSGTDRIEEAGATGDQYFLLEDRGRGTKYEAAGYESLEAMDTSMGLMDYIPVEKLFRFLYKESDKDTNYLYDDDHTEDDIQLIIYDNETGDILTHMYVSSASHYSFENH